MGPAEGEERVVGLVVVPAVHPLEEADEGAGVVSFLEEPGDRGAIGLRLVLGPERVHHQAHQRGLAGEELVEVGVAARRVPVGRLGQLAPPGIAVEMPPLQVGQLVGDHPGDGRLVGLVQERRGEDQEPAGERLAVGNRGVDQRHLDHRITVAAGHPARESGDEGLEIVESFRVVHDPIAAGLGPVEVLGPRLEPGLPFLGDGERNSLQGRAFEVGQLAEEAGEPSGRVAGHSRRHPVE